MLFGLTYDVSYAKILSTIIKKEPVITNINKFIFKITNVTRKLYYFVEL